MLITDKFVFIHMPKTGGTFVSSTLLRIHSSYLDLPHDYFFSTPPKKLKLVSRNVTENFDSPKYGSVVNQLPKHGKCRQIPQEHRKKQIVSILRNPYDWYVSQYEFGWWKKKGYWEHYWKVSGRKGRAPQVPKLSFEEFLAFQVKRPYKNKAFQKFGYYTQQFIYFFSHHPKLTASWIHVGYIKSGDYNENLFDVQFLRTDRLNIDFFEFLLATGYEADDVVNRPGFPGDSFS